MDIHKTQGDNESNDSTNEFVEQEIKHDEEVSNKSTSLDLNEFSDSADDSELDGNLTPFNSLDSWISDPDLEKPQK